MNEFKYIENKEMWPKESQHVEYAEVYRAVKSTEKLSVEDFMPWNIEHANQKRLFKNKFKQPEYGMSVFTSLESLKKKVSEFPALEESTRAYAKGFTTIKRGISCEENKIHHVEYYLYDYLENSPKDDFDIVEVREYEQE